MEGHHHKLSEEFPGYKKEIHALKISDAHFANVLARWEELDKKIARAEARIEFMSEADEKALRKQRLALKDELYQMLLATH
jgi:uncharacterized protein YdcH (DUF465 family)